jgi:hypothetical protein
VNVFAIERRHETRIDALVDLLNDRVAFSLDPLDLDGDARRIGRGFQQ